LLVSADQQINRRKKTLHVYVLLDCRRIVHGSWPATRMPGQIRCDGMSHKPKNLTVLLRLHALDYGISHFGRCWDSRIA
jgi:hypothetical protein